MNFLLLFVIVITGSKCSNYLDAKPDASLAIPKTLSDLQGLLDYYTYMNRSHPFYGAASADNYYLEDHVWESMSTETGGKMYMWEDQFLYDSPINAWYDCYRRIYYANEVLDRISTVKRDDRNEMEWDNVKGQALFHRANSFLEVASIWALAYDEAEETLGIPLRTTTDFNQVSERASNQATYDMIIADLKASAALLPEQAVHVMRPSKAAAYGLIARTYLFMRKYELAGAYADSCLRLKNNLMDYNQLDSSRAYPIEEFNEEIIWHARSRLPDPLLPGRLVVDSILFASYDENDLRKTLFFLPREEKGFEFKGFYTGNYFGFTGIAVDEILLVRSECLLREGDISHALADLNKLLKHRYKTGTYEPINITDPEVLMNKILQERRKELLMRGLRWPDIKRLNKEGRNIVLKRVIKGTTYLLEPNDLRYALPIPQEVLDRSKIVQNPR